MRRVDVTRTAKADIELAVDWYESQKEGLGDRFLLAVLGAIERIASNFEGYAKIVGEARRAEVQRFPYSIWFKVKDDVLVIACLHGKRSPALASERASITPVAES